VNATAFSLTCLCRKKGYYSLREYGNLQVVQVREDASRQTTNSLQVLADIVFPGCANNFELEALSYANDEDIAFIVPCSTDTNLISTRGTGVSIKQVQSQFRAAAMDRGTKYEISLSCTPV
jgi:hypothetical protein